MDQENQVEETENISEQPDAVVAEQTVAQEPEQAPVEEQNVATHRDGDIPTQQQAAQQAEPTRQPGGDGSRFDRLADALGNLPDDPNDRLLDGIDEKTIDKLPVEAKVMMRHMLADRLRDMERNKAA